MVVDIEDSSSSFGFNQRVPSSSVGTKGKERGKTKTKTRTRGKPKAQLDLLKAPVPTRLVVAGTEMVDNKTRLHEEPFVEVVGVAEEDRVDQGVRREEDEGGVEARRPDYFRKMKRSRSEVDGDEDGHGEADRYLHGGFGNGVVVGDEGGRGGRGTESLLAPAPTLNGGSKSSTPIPASASTPPIPTTTTTTTNPNLTNPTNTGITESPTKGRRITLFQETSEESFEQSLLAGGYARYGDLPAYTYTLEEEPQGQQRHQQRHLMLPLPPHALPFFPQTSQRGRRQDRNGGEGVMS